MPAPRSFRNRYRAIHCQIWNDDTFPFCSDDAQLALFHILTTPMSGPFGLFKAGLAALAEEKRWPLERYGLAFAELRDKGLVEFDKDRLVVWVPQVVRDNPPENPNVLTSWARFYEGVPQCELKAKAHAAVRAAIEGYGKAFQEAFAKGFGEGFRKGYREGYAKTVTSDQKPATNDQPGKEACQGEDDREGLDRGGTVGEGGEDPDGGEVFP